MALEASSSLHAAAFRCRQPPSREGGDAAFPRHRSGMIELTGTELALLALVCGAWLCLAGFAVFYGLRRAGSAPGERPPAGRADASTDSSPAGPLAVGRAG